MAFRFSLESVLRLRRSFEDLEQLRLQKLQGERALLGQQLSTVAAVELAVDVKMRSAMSGPAWLPGSEIQFAMQRLRACRLEQERLSKVIANMESQIAQQQIVFLQCRVQRKVLDQLCERQRSAYVSEAERRMSARSEELFLLRRGHETAGTKGSIDEIVMARSCE